MKTLIAIAAVLLLIFVVYAIKADREWRRWADTHCKIIGKTSGSVGIGSNGSSVFVPGKTGYQCDDGMTYWR